MSSPIQLSEKMKEYFRANYKNGDEESLQNTLIGLKRSGYSQMESLFLMVEEGGMTFVEANRTILNSRAWNS